LGAWNADVIDSTTLFSAGLPMVAPAFAGANGGSASTALWLFSENHAEAVVYAYVANPIDQDGPVVAAFTATVASRDANVVVDGWTYNATDATSTDPGTFAFFDNTQPISAFLIPLQCVGTTHISRNKRISLRGLFVVAHSSPGLTSLVPSPPPFVQVPPA
jgi:hypothetical protein